MKKNEETNACDFLDPNDHSKLGPNALSCRSGYCSVFPPDYNNGGCYILDEEGYGNCMMSIPDCSPEDQIAIREGGFEGQRALARCLPSVDLYAICKTLHTKNVCEQQCK